MPPQHVVRMQAPSLIKATTGHLMARVWMMLPTVFVGTSYTLNL